MATRNIDELKNSVSRRLKAAFEGTIKIGWIDGNGSGEQANQNRIAREATGQPTPAIGVPYSLAGIARTLNYGRLPGTTTDGKKYPEIPARPFMKFTMERIKKDLPVILKYDTTARQILAGIMAGTESPDKLKIYLGSVFVGTLKKAMRGEYGEFIGLSEATLKQRRKPHNGKPANANPMPLIDSGLLVNSATFEIEK